MTTTPSVTKRVRAVAAYIATSITALVGAINVLGWTNLTGDQIGAVSVIAGILVGLVVIITAAITGELEEG